MQGIGNQRLAAAPLQDVLTRDRRPLINMLAVAVVVVLLIACANSAWLFSARSVDRRWRGGDSRRAWRGTVEDRSTGSDRKHRACARRRRARDPARVLEPACAAGAAGSGLAGRDGHLRHRPGRARRHLCRSVVRAGARARDMRGSIRLRRFSRAAGASHRDAILRRCAASWCSPKWRCAWSLLVTSGLLVQCLARLQRVDLGFDPGNVVTAEVSMDDARYRNNAAANAFYDRVLEQIARAPGVESASVITNIPIDRGLNLPIRPPVPFRGQSVVNVDWRYVTDRLFQDASCAAAGRARLRCIRPDGVGSSSHRQRGIRRALFP